jgi:hypothetical protein
LEQVFECYIFCKSLKFALRQFTMI